MKHLLRSFVLPALILAAAASCNRIPEVEPEPEAKPEEVTVINVAAPGGIARTTRTSMGAVNEGKRPVYWTENDCLSLNGTASNPLTGVAAEQRSATFTFPGVIGTPYNLLYPSSFFKNANTITLPDTQTYAAGTFAANTSPLAGYATDGSAAVSMKHLTATVQLSVKKDAGVSASNLLTVRFRGNASEQVCGDFTIDYEHATLTAAGEGSEVTLNVGQPLSEADALELFLVVPARTYASGFTVVLEDAMHRTMTKVKASSATLEAGKLVKMTEFSFVPSALATTFDIADIIEEVLPPDGYNITGRVVDNAGNPLEGVVVSDGMQCVRTMFDGTFYMISETANVKFVHVSTPNGYLPQVSAGIPKHYKAIANVTPVAGVYDFGDFVLTPMANPGRVTLFISADPQERISSVPSDNVAYRSGRARESLFLEQKNTAAAITDRQVVGICLGDLVHGSDAENLALMDTFAGAMDGLGFPTYCIIGNHDYDTSKPDDDSGAWKFESIFGPGSYSFNMGGCHFVVLDNLIMQVKDGLLKDSIKGLTDEIWTWLQNDMAYVPTNVPIMVCSHAPMFKLDTGSERTNTSKHGGSTNESEGGAYGYGDLFDTYAEVHAWAGDIHRTFNFIYSKSHRHKNVEVHTLARSTGELWTNEYLCAGTPQGFTIVEIDNGNISWRFHPTKYLKSDFHGGYGQPSYTYRDWNYSSGSPRIAKMIDTGDDLDESYQMHVYTPGTYETGYVYANVFLWDSKWGTPSFTPDAGVATEMEHMQAYDNLGNALESAHDYANTEFKTFYVANYSATLGTDYTSKDKGLHTLFRVAVDGSVHGGTVSVTDRFGNNYSRHVSW